MAKAFKVDGDVICAGCVIETGAVGFTRVTVPDDATCEWCDAEHASMMLAVAGAWR